MDNKIAMPDENKNSPVDTEPRRELAEAPQGLETSSPLGSVATDIVSSVLPDTRDKPILDDREETFDSSGVIETLIQSKKIMKAVVTHFKPLLSGSYLTASVEFSNESNEFADHLDANLTVETELGDYTPEHIRAKIVEKILDYSTLNELGIAEEDIVFLTAPLEVEGERAMVKLHSGTVAGGAGAVSIDISADDFAHVDSVIWEADDATVLYSFGSKASSVSAVSCVVKRQTFASGNALLNLLGGIISVLTGVTQQNASNGTTVKATVIGRK